MLKTRTTKSYIDNVYIHIFVWFIVLAIPSIFFSNRGDGFNWSIFWKSAPSMLFIVFIFYINYLYLIEKYLFNHRLREFIIINLALVILAAILMHISYEFINSLNLSGHTYRRRRRPPALPFILRDTFSLITVAGLSVAVKMSGRWMQVDNERKELEKAKTEAELQNLKSQINPHFLLNTLNNIYALIDFNPSQAQQAVQDLSKLLRHILYDNKQTFVPLTQEVHFMENYIDLMRIRLPDNVQLTTEMKLQPVSNIQIAPLIFISLIENAFKHGVSGDKPSFIHIKLAENVDGVVNFTCENSYFPKSQSDKSGKGIGLQQVQKRLDMLYPKGYVWDTQRINEAYTTTLIIDTTKGKGSDDVKLLDS